MIHVTSWLSVVMANFECRCGIYWFKHGSQHSQTNSHITSNLLLTKDPRTMVFYILMAIHCTKKTPKLQTVWIHYCLPVHDIALEMCRSQNPQQLDLTGDAKAPKVSVMGMLAVQ